MRIRRTLATAAALAVALAAPGVVRADDGNDLAAHLCLDEPQLDYFVVANSEGDGFVDYGTLQHGWSQEEGMYYVETSDHGECVSFFAANKSKGSSTGKVSLKPFTIMKKADKSSPIL